LLALLLALLPALFLVLLLAFSFNTSLAVFLLDIASSSFKV